jgi:hypothetical protein
MPLLGFIYHIFNGKLIKEPSMSKCKMIFGLLISCLLLIPTTTGSTSAVNAPSQHGSGTTGVDENLGKEIIVSELDNSKWSPAIAYNSLHNQYLVVWENQWPGGNDIYGQRISTTGELLSWFSITTFTNSVMQPSVAYDPVHDRYLVTYVYDVFGDGSDWDVYGRFIPWDGPDPTLVDFMICDWTSNQAHAKIAYGLAQDEFLAVWMNSAGSGVATYISGRRIFADGSGFPPGDGFTISYGTENRDFPSVAYNLARNEYLVTWDVANASLDIFGLRLDGTGNPLGGGEFSIAGWPDDEEHPSVAACNQADQYLVTWQSMVNPPIDSAIYARYIWGDGTPAGVYLVDDTTAPEAESAVVCNKRGQHYLITWQTMYAGGNYGIWARRAFRDESMGNSFGVVAAGNNADRTYPAVSGGRVNYLVAWEHQRDGTSYQDIHARLVTPVTIFLPFARK